MGDESLTRLNCAIPDATNEKLNAVIPHGVKSDIIRALVDVFLKAAARDGRSIVMDILDGKVELVRVSTDGT